MRPSTLQIVLLVLVVLLLFGAPKLPELARSLGKSMRILKDETTALTEDGKAAAAESDDDGKKPEN